MKSVAKICAVLCCAGVLLFGLYKSSLGSEKNGEQPKFAMQSEEWPKARNYFWLVRPEPFASSVSEKTEVLFETELEPSVTHGDVEQGVSLERISDGRSVEGTFRWTTKGGEVPREQLAFVPAEPLSSNTEYVVKAHPHASFQPERALFVEAERQGDGSFKAPFTTANSLRLAWIKIVSKDKKAARYIRWRFSEPIAAETLVKQVTVSTSGGAASGHLDTTGKVAQEFEFAFDDPVDLKETITLDFGTALASAKQPDAKMLWGTQLPVVLNKSTLRTCGSDDDCWQWLPKVD